MESPFPECLGAPAFEGSAVKVLCEVGVLHPVLQVAVCCASRAIEPGRHKNPDRSHPVRIDVKVAENLRLRKPEGVEHCARFERAVRRQLDHGFHSNCPIVTDVTLWKPKMRIQLRADCANRTIADHRQCRVDIGPGRIVILWVPVFVHALVHHSDAPNRIALQQGRGDGRCRPNLSGAPAHDILSYP
ncbi:MAG: hypothetical protein BWY82_00256 [Verrucomicrobia bacterium ADurb.Bin474]|nr:MAG: hypothetical protein BWY82_00256 [Verrucomicrobia bacterium ADurb.Bin474]